MSLNLRILSCLLLVLAGCGQQSALQNPLAFSPAVPECSARFSFEEGNPLKYWASAGFAVAVTSMKIGSGSVGCGKSALELGINLDPANNAGSTANMGLLSYTYAGIQALAGKTVSYKVYLPPTPAPPASMKVEVTFNDLSNRAINPVGTTPATLSPGWNNMVSTFANVSSGASPGVPNEAFQLVLNVSNWGPGTYLNSTIWVDDINW